MKRVAFHRSVGLGDCIMASIFAIYPYSLTERASITFFTSNQFAEIFECYDFIDEVLPSYLFRNKLELRRFDEVYDLQNPLTIGDRPLLFQSVVKDSLKIYNNEMKIEFPMLKLPQERLQQAEKILKERNHKGLEVIALAPISDGRNRTYDPENLLKLIENLVQRYFVIFVGKDKYGWGIKNWKFQNLLLLTESSILDVACFINFASKAIATDSGIMHLLAAELIPTLALFGSIDPEMRVKYYPSVKPLFPEGEMPCIPCNDSISCFMTTKFGSECLRLLVPERILKSFEEMKEVRARVEDFLEGYYRDIFEERNPYPYFPSKGILKEDNKRILFIVPHLILGGGEVQLVSLLSRLSGYEVKILVMNKLVDEVIVEEIHGKEVIYCKGNQEVFVRKVIKEFSPSVIIFHANYILHKALVGIENRPVILQIIHTGKGPWSIESLKLNSLYVDKAITVASWIKKELENYGEFSNVDFVTIPNGVELRGEGKEDFRKGIEAKLVLGILARFSYEKKIVPLIKAIKDNPDLGLIIGGWGKLEDEIQEEIVRNHLEKRVKMIGKVSDIRSFFNSIDVAICSSETEGNSLFLLEAALAGIPVISTKVGAVEEMFGDDYFPIDYLEEVNQVAEYLIKFPDERKRIGEKGKKRIESVATSEIMAKSYIEVIEKERQRRIKPKTALLKRWGGLGDIIMSIPSIKSLIERDIRVTYLTSAKGKTILERIPNLEVVTDMRFNEEHKKYDLAIDLSHYEVWDTHEHIIDHYLKLVGGEIGNRDFDILEVEPSDFYVPDNCVFIASKSNFDVKDWGSAEEWTEIREYLVKEKGMLVMNFSGDYFGMPLTPFQSIQLLKKARLLITIDSFPVHAAKIVGIPAIVIYGGSSHPDFCGYPEFLNVLPRIDCKCDLSKDHIKSCDNELKCLKSITVEMIKEKINEVLGNY